MRLASFPYRAPPPVVSFCHQVLNRIFLFFVCFFPWAVRFAFYGYTMHVRFTPLKGVFFFRLEFALVLSGTVFELCYSLGSRGYRSRRLA